MVIVIVLGVLSLGVMLLSETLDSAWQPRLGLGWLASFAVASIVTLLGIPIAVQFAAFSLEAENHPRFALGLGLIALGAIVVDLGQAIALRGIGNQVATSAADVARIARRELVFFQTMMCVGLQVIALFLFGLIMDGGIHFRAARTAYLYYAIPALVLLILRRRRMTRVERQFLRWGWAPILAAGVPLLLREWKANGKLLEYTFL